MSKLAIVTTHPIQYNAPWFKMLSERGNIELKVFYTWEQAQEKVYDPLFKREIKWDIPLLEGYDYIFLKNIAKDPGSHHFAGIDNPEIIDTIKNYKPDAVLVFGWSFKSHLKVLRYFSSKVRILFRGDSTLLNDLPGLKSLMRKFFLKWIYSHIDTALYVGQKNKDYYLNAGLRIDQLMFAPHAIDNARFENFSGAEEVVSWREKLSIPVTDKVFLFAGKLEPRKNPHILVKVFTRLQIAGLHLVFVGNGMFEDELKKDCAAFPNIHFVDFQNQKAMPSIYHFSDVFVLPSLSETWGLAVNEAMACGKVILISDKCGCAVDLVKDGINGYKFQSENEDDLYEKMKSLSIKTAEELDAMGKVSYNIIQNWSFEKISLAIESLMKA